MDHDRRKLWTFMLNSLRPKKLGTQDDAEALLLQRLGCIRSAAKVVSVPPEDPVFRGHAVLCVAKALAAEQDREPLEALEECFRDILTQSAKPPPDLSSCMPERIQVTWRIQDLLHAMGPNFADTCHRTLLTSSRPEPLSSAALLRACCSLLRAGIRPGSSALCRSVALRAKLACSLGDPIDEMAEDEAQERLAALDVLSHMLLEPNLPEDLSESILEFLNGDEVFEEPFIVKNLTNITAVALRHKAYHCCLRHFRGDSTRFEFRRLKLLTILAVKTPGLRCQHLKLLQGRLKLEPVRCLQGLRHLRRLLKIGLPKEDVQQAFATAFQLVRSENPRLRAVAVQLCADASRRLRSPKRKTRSGPQSTQALFLPRRKKRRIEQQVATPEALLPLLAAPAGSTSELMAVSGLALEVCRLHIDQESQEGVPSSAKLFRKLHRWLLRSLQECGTSPKASRTKSSRRCYAAWLRRSTQVLRQLFRRWAPRTAVVQELLTLVLCQDPKGRTKPRVVKKSELRWRCCVLAAAASEVPGVLADLRWPDLERDAASEARQRNWRPVPNELSAKALVWWQALFNAAGEAPLSADDATSRKQFRSQVLEHFRKYARSAIALRCGRHLLRSLAALAAANGLQEDARTTLQRCIHRPKRWERLLSFTALRSSEADDEEKCTLLEKVRHLLAEVRAAASGPGADGVVLSRAIEDLDRLAANPLLPAACRAALGSWKLLAELLQKPQQPLTPELALALQQASQLALAQQRRPFEPSHAIGVMPLPRCLFGALGRLQVKLTTRLVNDGRLGTLLIDGEPELLGPVGDRKRVAKAIHRVWDSTEILVADAEGEESWTLPRHFPGQFQEAQSPAWPPLAFQSRCFRNLSSSGSASAKDQRFNTLRVTLKTSSGICLAFGEADLKPDLATESTGQEPPPEAPAPADGTASDEELEEEDLKPDLAVESTGQPNEAQELAPDGTASDEQLLPEEEEEELPESPESEP